MLTEHYPHKKYAYKTVRFILSSPGVSLMTAAHFITTGFKVEKKNLVLVLGGFLDLCIL